MRKLLCLLMIMALPLGFVACGGDDDEEETWGQEINPIEGTWVRNDKEERLTFTSDFKMIEYYWNTALKKWEYGADRTYLINEKSIKDAGWYYPYRFEGNDVLYIQFRNVSERKYLRETE